MKISEFPVKQKVIYNKLINLDNLIKHLIKLIIFDSPNNNNHWKQEVYALFNNIPKQNKNNKFPSSQYIYNTIWNYYGDRLDIFC